MAWALPLLPILAGGLVWAAGRHVALGSRPRTLGAAAVGTLLATLLLSIVAAGTAATATHDLGGALTLTADLAPPANVVAVLVPGVAAVVVAWTAAHEPPQDLPRLLGLLTVFVGAMQLVVVAADLLTLVVGFELVGALSWALIGHDWRDASAPRAGAHAFNATRFGGLGLFVAAGAAFASTGSLAFDDLAGLAGAELHVVVAGVLLAAAAKSAQGPFAPWLFSAMAGPSPVSALLHSSTMVAAGAYVLARLHPVLDRVDWFATTTVGLGLVTALAGGVVALLQDDAKKLLAASTAAQYGLMLVAVGAGYPTVAILHLVVHAAFKAQLFLSAGVAIRAVGSRQLGRMRLGRQLRATAALTAVGGLALAAVPPLGGGWSKEAVVAAAGHLAPGLAVAVIVAGGLSAAYATRFHLLAFGPVRGDPPGPRQLAARPSRVELGAIGVLAATSIVLGALWLPPVQHLATRVLDGELARGPAWELASSLAVLGVAAYGTLLADRQRGLGHVGTTGATAAWGDWLGLPTLTRRAVVDPSLRAAAALATFDDRVVDGAVGAAAVAGRRTAFAVTTHVEPWADGLPRVVARSGHGLARVSTVVAERGLDVAVAAVAWLVDRAAADARRTHTGFVHHQFVAIVVGLGIVAVAAAVGR